MEWLNRVITIGGNAKASPLFRRCVILYKKNYKEGYIWTFETGCLVFTSLIIYYLTFMSSREGKTQDKLVTLLFILGALAYVISSSIFRKLKIILEDNPVVKLLKVTNKYTFMILSYIPGIYFAFQYDEFILHFYLVIHLVTTGYFFYKRCREFVLIQFLIGLAMSFTLGSIGPTIRLFFAFFGHGWLPTTMAATLVTLIDTSVAIAFMFRLPEKHLPGNMIFGLKVVKYLMFIFSWRTFFILMVFITWRNIGAAALTLFQIYSKDRGIQAEEENKHLSPENEVKSKSS